MTADPTWYKDAIIYQLHVKAFRDSDGDGVGDFRGLTEKLGYLEELGVTALWLLPFYPSPLRDDGYDIADYRNVHASYGTLDDFRRFLDEAHRRDLDVITELVINHTSDQHPWFQRARRSPPGSPQRDFYVWSDTPDRYAEARIIFKDFESSNWTWDPVAEAYYWHRFYHHQPDLNFENPAVREAVFEAMEYWLEMGVDGLRLDAVPYLFEREGTNCENLPETHDFLRALRARVDARFEDKMLLAEANQWPEDAVAYFGQGDECHMAFHFPIMPRLFMGIRMEDRFPILDIIEQTPEIPESCQWAVFLRNHDELTLEMVTDEERDYMYRVYASDPRARINLGIRRRLAPLLQNNRKKMELMMGLLLSLPGTPVLYYGDEIGMGDNIYLGDRNGVRTPMQWNGDRNAGFSEANPQRLYLPVVIDPEYRYEAVNVEAQRNNPSSLLWWVQRLIALRKRFAAFGRGTLTPVKVDNPKVLAFLREHENERILAVFNLSRFSQPASLELPGDRGVVPTELFGGTAFPAMGDRPYLFTLGPHSFHWFSLRPEAELQEDRIRVADAGMRNVVTVAGPWTGAFEPAFRERLEEVLPDYLAGRRWFAGKAQRMRSVRVGESIPISYGEGAVAFCCLLETTFVEGDAHTYMVPMTYAAGERADALREDRPGAVICRLRQRDGAEEGVLHDATVDPAFNRALLELISGAQTVAGREGWLDGWSTPALRELWPREEPPPEPVPLGAEQSNTSIAYGDRLILKLFRRVQPGVNPDVEISRFLTESGFAHTPPVAGGADFRSRSGETASALLLQGFVANEGDAWHHTLDALSRFFERAAAVSDPAPEVDTRTESLLERAARPPAEDVAARVGPYLESARLIGRRTAEMHAALSSGARPSEFSAEPFSELDQRSLYQSMRNSAGQVFRTLEGRLSALDEETAAEARRVLDLREEIIDRFRALTRRRIHALRIRTHGDYHLGQLLFTGRDFVIIDFEGEPARPLGERRLKRSGLRDVAGMIRSLHYAAYSGLQAAEAAGLAGRGGGSPLEPWARLWYAETATRFLEGYLESARTSAFVPRQPEEMRLLLDAHLLEKAVYEVGYELGSRPDWTWIPARGVLELLGARSRPGHAAGRASSPPPGREARVRRRTRMASDVERATRELAESHGVLLAYRDIRGRRQEASVDSLRAALRALGAPLEGAADGPDALRARRQDLRTLALDPVVVSWEGERTEVRVRTVGDGRSPRCGLELEDGREVALDPPPDLPAVGWVEVEGRTVVTRALELPAELPLGYHRLWAEVGARRVGSLVIRAPGTAWRPEPGRTRDGAGRPGGTDPGGADERRWGVFLPLYALRTARDWGAGDFTDLEQLLRWTREMGGRLVGTLPLLATYLDEPFDPSPYAPVSRLFWNDLYVDPTRAPGWSAAGGREENGTGAPLLGSDLRELRARERVDYRRVAALKRRQLEPLARRFFEEGAEREEAFGAFLREHPRAGDYARFRATAEERRQGWSAWPDRLRGGKLRPGDYDPERVRYHLFVQWVAELQLSDLSRAAGGDGGDECHLYLDLPLGAHPAGYDCWRERDSFAHGAAAGAPPDEFFSGGQNWGFPPLHPERMRERGYSYFIDCLRHNMRHAGALRIDHVMGLHRLFWVPDGLSATDGVYVRYPARELWAILCLESHRQRCRVTGEDLGTVPPEVREAMERHRVDGLYVVQYEVRPEADEPLAPARRGQVASLNTHDMYPFAAWWEGLDVEDRRQLGLLAASDAAEERRRRATARERLASFLQRRGRPRGMSTEAALAGALEELADGPAHTLLVNLEDLWLETKPHNVPGTSEERPNWRRRARHPLDRIRSDEGILARLARVDALRRARPPHAADEGEPGDERTEEPPQMRES